MNEPADISINQRIVSALSNQQFDIIKEFIQDPNSDLSFDDNYLIKTSCDVNYTEIVELLLGDNFKHRIDPSVSDNYCIQSGLCKNDPYIILLLKIVAYPELVTEDILK